MARHPPTQDPEIPFGPEFAEDVRRAREYEKLSQESLAERVGATQPVISAIERYDIKKSKLVRPLCRILGLSMPLPYTDDALLRKAYFACRLLADSEEDLQVVVSVAERLLHLSKLGK